MPEATPPKPLKIEKMIGARMDLPFGMGSARKMDKFLEEQEKIATVKAEAEELAKTKAEEAAAAAPVEVPAPPEETAAPEVPTLAVAEAPAAAPASAPAEEGFLGKVVGLFSHRG